MKIFIEVIIDIALILGVLGLIGWMVACVLHIIDQQAKS